MSSRAGRISKLVTVEGMDDGHSDSALAEALRFIQMAGVFYCPSELSEPWGIELPPMDGCLWFHAVLQGEMLLEVDERRHNLVAGDLVLIPHGTGHLAWSGDDSEPTPSVLDLPHDYYSDRFAVLRHGGAGPLTRLVCGGIQLGHPAARHLIDALPSLIHIESAQSSRSDWLRTLIELMGEETRQIKTGSEIVISRLCDIVVVQAIRSWLNSEGSTRTGWLRALQDAQIGHAISRVHGAPDEPWTVDRLADEVSMSRSAFSARFTELVGESPGRYVTRWRMQVALDLLRTTDLTVAATASRVGYESEAAFSRAFKRVVGVGPGSARRSAASDAQPKS